MPTATTHASHLPRWSRILAIVVAVLLALMLLLVLFPWDVLRGPVNRYVSQKTGRHFEITRHLDVKLGRTTRVLMDGIEFANPDWAQDRYLVKADAAEVDVHLLPLLLHRRIELPLVKLTKPELGLQIEPDGRRTWALGGDTRDEKSVPQIGAMVVDQGTAHYVAQAQGADVHAEFAMRREAAGNPAALPLQFKAKGRWKDQPFNADGRTGDVLSLNGPQQQPFPAEVRVTAGGTSLRANGSVANLAELDGADVRFQLGGQDLAQLYKLVGVVLPNTPRYAIAGHLAKQGEVWRVSEIDGRLGRSDVAGELAFSQAGQRPSLQGQLRSRMLDFEDLGPLIGIKDDPAAKKEAARAAAETRAGEKPKKAKKDPNRKVLPDAPLDVSRLKTMDADVRVDAARVMNAKGLPLDRMGVHVHLKNGVLVLDPLDLGVAGGQLAGTLRIDANAKPAQAQARLDGRALELSRLVPASKTLRESIGKLQAQIDMTARGGSVRQMLASSNGRLALLMGEGEISNLLLEFAGLDGGEIIKFFTEGDQRVQVRCAVAAFDVQDGQMSSRALLFDTTDTVFNGAAKVNLATEGLDVYLKPQPKDKSILSLRSPLKVTGTFGDLHPSLDKAALAKRAVAAIGLGAVNPLLALFATVETGPGRDADCVGIMKSAAASRAEARVEQTAPPVAGAGGKSQPVPTSRMGAGPAPTVKAAPRQEPAGEQAAQPATPQLTQRGTPATANAP